MTPIRNIILIKESVEPVSSLIFKKVVVEPEYE